MVDPTNPGVDWRSHIHRAGSTSTLFHLLHTRSRGSASSMSLLEQGHFGPFCTFEMVELEEATERFRIELGGAIRSKIELLQEKRAKLPQNGNRVREWIDSRFSDEIVSLAEADYDLEHGFRNLRQPARARACLEVMREAAVHPVAVEAELLGLLEVLAS